jgi:hypothetical protein
VPARIHDLRVKELIKQEAWTREEIDLLKQQKDLIEKAKSNIGETSVATTTQSHNPRKHFKDKQEEPTSITYEIQSSK